MHPKKARRLLKYRTLRILDEALYRRAKVRAAEEGVTLIAWLEDAIEEKIARGKEGGSK